MELGKHLGKGMWGLADKALPVIYGLAYIWLVIRVLPEEEFGNFVLVQEIFLVISGLATAFALQPLLKFSSEDNADLRQIVSASLLLNAAFVAAASFVVIALSVPAAQLFNSPALSTLLLFVPAMLAASFARNFTMMLLQAKFRIREVFWMDALHFLGAPFLVWVQSRMHTFDSAFDMIIINILSLSLSSVAGLWFTRGIAHITLFPSRPALLAIWHYGKYTLGGVVSSLFSTRADSFILSAFTGPVQVAVYNSAKVFVRVYEMAGQVVQMFVLPASSRFASREEWGALKALTEKATLFLTLGLLPFTVLFLVVPNLLVEILYGGRYEAAVPVLRVFSMLTFVVPLAAVGNNVLMGLGQVRLTFVLGLQVLGISLVAFFVCIPSGGSFGAGVGYLVAAVLTAVLTWYALVRHVPLTLSEILRRIDDVKAFLRNRL